jgi:hypothetical protein
MTGIDLDFNTSCKGDYLAIRENNQNLLRRSTDGIEQGLTFVNPIAEVSHANSG